MGGRGRVLLDEGTSLAIRTDVKGKGSVVVTDDAATKGEAALGGPTLHRNTSNASLATSVDDAHNTYLSASSAANTDTLSSSEMSALSTARTSAITEEDRPNASTSTSTSTSPNAPLHAHPKAMICELVSNAASSSALYNGFGFNISRKGSFVAVYSASNVWLIKASGLPRLWARTLEVKRKPVAVDMSENGFLLAILSRPTQVDVFELHGNRDRQIKKRRTIGLVHEANSVALSPDGLILITGNKFGIEVVAISPEAPESRRRVLSGPVGDTLEFSEDGRTLLITGYARKSGQSSMYVLPGLYDGPLSEDGVPIPQSPEMIWTGQVLFPESAKIARQATLLPDADTGHINELFAFNATEDTWGVYDMASMRFTQQKMFLPDQQRWTRSEFLDDAMPAVSPDAQLAAVSLRIRGTTSIWIYQVPEWDFRPKSQKAEQAPIHPCFRIPVLPAGTDTHQEISVLRWVKMGKNVQRLIAVGNVGTAPEDSEMPAMPQSSNGVLVILDFDKASMPGGPVPTPMRIEFDLDVLLPGERLPESDIDFEQEVELVRTRTIAQRRAQERSGQSRRDSRIASGSGPSRAQTNRERPTSIRPPVPPIPGDEEELTREEAQAAFEQPYDISQPRSQFSLARAATVSAVSPANRRHLRALPFRPLEYRRADGLREFPHESDADNWVPPPPAYTATAEASQSVSLSHPNTPPTQARMAPAASTTAVPSTSQAPSNPSRTPYPTQTGMVTQSVTDLTTQTSLRRPSLMHPSTFPTPQAEAIRRPSHTSPRGSVSRGPISHPQSHPQTSAYMATAAENARRRPRNAFGVSMSELRPPPSMDRTPSGRRGSAPDAHIHRRPVPVPHSPNRASMPVRSGLRNMVPRLTTAQNGPGARLQGSESAPPMASTGGYARAESRADKREKKKGGGLRGHRCVVM